MYSPFQLALKYARYFFTASNGKGHGIHSPFVFNFIEKVLNDRSKKQDYENIEAVRKELLLDKSTLTIEDFGAGSTVSKSNQRKVKDIAVSALKPAKFGQLFYRIAAYYKPSTIIELGTSLGISTSYLAAANKARVYTFEGATSIASIARKNFQKNNLSSIKLVEGDFNNTLAKILPNITTADLVYVDGNHRKEPTIAYFHQLLSKANENSIFIFDDIHWSKEMEEAWEYIKSHSAVTLTIDLFFIGLVFFRKEQKVQQHFVIRF
jgi:predicted O-methyltransferase YrrM